jgi:D-alanyl-D-alanine-carboxypeptidase/D-alanyl-D-alanine-endopeptidase
MRPAFDAAAVRRMFSASARAQWPKWIGRSAIRFGCLAFLSVAYSLSAAAEDFSDSVHAFLKHSVDAEKIDGGIVFGIVDEQGNHVISYGKLDNGTDQGVNGDTLFEMGSDTKTFTALLLADMIERGEMNLDDPVAKYLPASIQMPTNGGKQITLHHLATHTSGLPGIPDNLDPKRADNPYADFTVEKLYDFLSRYQLSRDPGEKSEYSNLGVGLLGHAIALKAGKDYESLVVERVCRPLKMDSTRITLSPELNARFAVGHNRFGERVPHWDVPTLAGAGALRSTANDMLKYLSANLGLAPSSLTPQMEKTQQLGLTWFVERDQQGAPKIISHGGGTGGFRSFTGFDKSRRRGVVVLSNTVGAIDVDSLGKFLLRSEWRLDARATATNTSRPDLSSYTGQYQRLPGPPPFLYRLKEFLIEGPRPVVHALAGILIAVPGVLFWRAESLRKRLIIAGCTAPVYGLVVAILALGSPPTVDAPFEPGIGVRREGDRLFAQTLSVDKWPMCVVLPPVAGELLPETDTRFFERLSGRPVTFSRDAQGRVTGFTARTQDGVVSYARISDQPPIARQPLKPPAIVKLDGKMLDAVVGRYEFSSNAVTGAGFKLKIWREGEQLVARAEGKGAIQGAFEIYPESETTFFSKINEARLTFFKNNKGEVLRVTHHEAGVPDFEGKKLRDK